MTAKRISPSTRQNLIIAITGLLGALGAIYAIVPRIKLVEAAILFATAFGAGAAFALAVAEHRRKS